jgi:hypothetical protein
MLFVKHSWLITLVGLSVDQLLNDLCSTTPADEKLYTKILELLQNHYRPRRCVNLQRQLFTDCKQRPGETFQVYAVELRHLAPRCEYGTFLDEA